MSITSSLIRMRDGASLRFPRRMVCVPPSCAPDYVELGLSHVVVAVDPGKKVLGYVERTCGQDIQAVAAGSLLAVDGEAIEVDAP